MLVHRVPFDRASPTLSGPLSERRGRKSERALARVLAVATDRSRPRTAALDVRVRAFVKR